MEEMVICRNWWGKWEEGGMEGYGLVMAIVGVTRAGGVVSCPMREWRSEVKVMVSCGRRKGKRGEME